MNTAEMLSKGKEQTINLLWKLASGSDVSLKVSAEQQAKLVEDLRRFADVLESTPELVSGVVLIGGIDEAGGIRHYYNLLGTTPSVAASYLELEDEGRDALKKITPELLAIVLSGQIDQIDKWASKNGEEADLA